MFFSDSPDEFTDWTSYKRFKKNTIKAHSRQYWRDVCARKVSNFLLFRQYSNSEIASAFEIIEDVMLEVDEQNLARDVMSEFVEIFSFLVKCAQMEEMNVRRRSQLLFIQLLSSFMPIAQQLLLCRLFELVAINEIKVEKEPQVLAWLIDTYRKKLHDSKCKEIFLHELSHIFGQINEVVYDDMLAGHHFYASALLLLADQSVAGNNLSLLKALQIMILDKFQKQLSDFLQMKQLSKNKRVEKLESIEPPIHDSMFALDLLKFTLADTTAKLKKALTAAES